VTHILEAFHEAGCEEMREVILLPTQAAKRMSPLDNALFHVWKDACHKHELITDRTIERIMADEWNAIKKPTIEAYYKHCKITSRSNVFADCPAPAEHQHEPRQRRRR